MASTVDENYLFPDNPDGIYTVSGRYVRPLSPTVDDFDEHDIAHALSNQCRFTGHTRRFYSVAEHSVHVSALVPPALALTALLHDASEAYLSDIARPLKYAVGFGDAYREVETRLERAIALRFGAIYPYPPEVKEADDVMLAREIHTLLPREFAERFPVHPREKEAPRPVCWGPRAARSIFIAQLRGLR